MRPAAIWSIPSRSWIKHLKWIDEINGKVKKAVRYPSFMLVVILGLFLFMMTSVVPHVTSFLQSNGQKLPFITLSLIATSDFVQKFWWVIIAAPVTSVVVLNVLARSSQDMAYRVDFLKLRLPMFGHRSSQDLSVPIRAFLCDDVSEWRAHLDLSGYRAKGRG